MKWPTWCGAWPFLPFVTCTLLAAAACSSGADLARLAHGSAPDRAPRYAAARAFDLMPRHTIERRPDEVDQHPAATNGQRRPSVRVSPGGEWIAFESDRGGLHSVYVVRRNGGDQRRVSGAHMATLPAWSPDGGRLVFVERTLRAPDVWAVWIHDLASGRSTRVGSAGGTDLTRPVWFPDGSRVCFGNEDRVTVVEVATSRTTVVHVPGGRHLASSPAVAPDGQRVVFAVTGGGVWLATLVNGRVTPVTRAGQVDALAWSPGGHEVALRNASDGQWFVEPVR